MKPALRTWGRLLRLPNLFTVPGDPLAGLCLAAAVAGNFQQMVRIADSIGIPMDDDYASEVKPTVDELELRRFKSAENSPP